MLRGSVAGEACSKGDRTDTCGMVGSFVLQNVFWPTKDAFGFRLGCLRIKYPVIYFFPGSSAIMGKNMSLPTLHTYLKEA